MDENRRLLLHLLATLAYRTQKALRDAPAGFDAFRIAEGVRTPVELLRHMTAVLGYARTCFVGGHYRPEALPTLRDETMRFHVMLEDLAEVLNNGVALREEMRLDQLLQGPLSDAMTHAGQLAMLRRLAGSPIAPESFIDADIRASRLGWEQAPPVRPHTIWPEAPPFWKPPEDA